MRSRRIHLLRLLAWMALFVLAVRPVAAVDRGLSLAASPLRAVAELSAPLAWLSGRRARAADDARFFQRGAEDLAEIETLWEDLVALARPTRPELLRGRELVPAEVAGRVEGDRDRLLVRVADPLGLVPGLPVVHGDTYVGRVARVEPDGEVEVHLVTDADFAVGARLVPEADAAERGGTVWMTVGGLASDPDRPGAGAGDGPGRLALAARNPSDREAVSGRVEVFELLPDVDPFAELAQGYSLGTLVAGADEPRILADVDYGAGLYEVHVLAPEGARAGASGDLELAVADASWRPARVLVSATPTPWRSGAVVSRGSRAGVRAGAAVIAGLRMVGRVERAGLWSADVRGLADPGLALVAVARLEGDPVPRVLGRIVSEGRSASDPDCVSFRWDAVVAVELGAGRDERGRPAELFTGWGERGLPGGLYLGEAWIRERSAAGPARVLLAVEPEIAGDLWVRSAPAASVDPASPATRAGGRP